METHVLNILGPNPLPLNVRSCHCSVARAPIPWARWWALSMSLWLLQQFRFRALAQLQQESMWSWRKSFNRAWSAYLLSILGVSGRLGKRWFPGNHWLSQLCAAALMGLLMLWRIGNWQTQWTMTIDYDVLVLTPILLIQWYNLKLL